MIALQQPRLRPLLAGRLPNWRCRFRCISLPPGSRAREWSTADIAARAQPGALGMLYLSRYMFYPADIQVQSVHRDIWAACSSAFPKLKIVSAENDVGWLPHFMFRLDHGYDKFSGVRWTRACR